MSIWYDVSGIYYWEGTFTGIQRVVYNLGKELATNNPDAKFFIYHVGRFTEVDFAEVEARLAASEKGSKKPVTKREPLTAGKIYHRTMVTIKETVRSTPLEGPLRNVYGVARKAYRSTRSGAVQTVATYSHIFNEGDVVVIVDGNWQFGGYAEALAVSKSRNHFKLLHFVHDLVAVKNPALANPGANKIIGGYFRKIFRLADGLIAISESTKRDIEWFVAEEGITHRPKLYDMNLGDNMRPGPKPSPKKPKQNIECPFILAVSTIEVRKNYNALYYIYKLAHEQSIELPSLIISGRKGWMSEETWVLLTKDPDVNQKILITQADDEELEWLYQNCLFTVFPSFYEGWGLPIAESLAHGKCCVSSNTSSMLEVGDDLVAYVSPYDPAAMLGAIRTLLDDTVRSRSEDDIKKRYHTRTWEDSYHEFEACIHKYQETKS